MKNKLGKIENLKEYHKNGKLAYEFKVKSDGYSWEKTFDDRGNQTSYQDSRDNSWSATFDDQGNQTSYKNSYGEHWKRIYNEDGSYEQIKF